LSDALTKKLVAKRIHELTEAILKEAASGNMDAWKELANRTEGKVAERLEITGNVDLGMRIAAARERRRLAGNANIDAESDLPSLPVASLKPV
jgi:hypothetical protein